MQNTTLKLPDSMRAEFKKPFGEVISEDRLIELDGLNVIAIGDSIAYNLISKGINPRVVVIDNKTERNSVSDEIKERLKSWKCEQELTLENKASFIEKESWIVAKKALEAITRVIVDGEEDLLVMPFAITAPNGWRVAYGLPGKGAVIIVIDDALKIKFKKILESFEKWN